MKHLTDDQLERSIELARKQELESTASVLRHLREIDRRKLFSKRGYTSLYDYAMKKLKYSGDEAHRRISAMRLLKDIPEIEAKINDGSLTLTNLSQAQSFFRKSDHTKEEKVEILAKLENATKAQAKAILKPDEQNVRYSFEADQALEEVIERLRGLHPHLNFDQLMKKVLLFAFEKFDPSEKAKRIQDKKSRQSTLPDKAGNNQPTLPDKVSDTSLLGKPTPASKAKRNSYSRYIPAEMKREVWLKAEGKCENCSSKFALEYDHIVPFAKGGLTIRKNLRLLCRNCNQQKAAAVYGLEKMSSYIKAMKTHLP